MTQKDTIAEMAVKNGFWLYLEHLLVPPLAAEYRRAHDELRKDGWIITVKQNYQERGKNIYHYIPPDGKILPTPETHTEALQSTQPTGDSNVGGKGTFKGLQKNSGIVQVKIPCSSCGSCYRREGKCNICGKVHSK